MPGFREDHPLLARQDGGACPSLDDTTIGSVEQFRIFCGTRIDGTELDELDAQSLQECVELCSAFHPRCTAVTFSGARCRLKSNFNPDATRPSRFLDSAAGLGPVIPPSSNCQSLGGNTQASRQNFDTFCDTIFNGNDIEQQHATTLEECLTKCTANEQCGGVSFDASLDLGFRNCYLKTPFVAGDLIDDAGIDSAILNGPVGGPVPDQANPDPVTVTEPGAVVTLTALPPPAGPIFSITGFSTLVGAPSFLTLTEIVESTVTTNLGQVNDIPITQILTIPLGSTTRVITNPGAGATVGELETAAPTAVGGQAEVVPQGAEAGDNLAWIAAPVIGGIAAILLVVVMFVLWGKRKARRGQNSPATPATPPLSPWVPPFIGNYWRAWSDKKNGVVRLQSPPASRAGREKNLGSSDGEKEWGRGGGGGGATASVYEVTRDGRLELRDNELTLNAPILEQLPGARQSAIGKAA